MIDTEGIRATGLYLLEVLKSEKVIRYSRFYNHAPGTEDCLVAGAMPFVVDREACDAEDLREEGHVMLEYARATASKLTQCLRFRGSLRGITSARKMINQSRVSGILHVRGLEVTGDAGRPMEHDAHPALHPRPQFLLAVGQALVVDIALQVVVQ
jgi:hypothetical protein